MGELAVVAFCAGALHVELALLRAVARRDNLVGFSGFLILLVLLYLWLDLSLRRPLLFHQW